MWNLRRDIASNTGTVVWDLAVVVAWHWDLFTAHFHVRISWEPVDVTIHVPEGAKKRSVRGYDPPGTTSQSGVLIPVTWRRQNSPIWFASEGQSS